MTVDDASEFLEVTPCRVRQLIKSGRLMAEKVDGRYVVEADSVITRVTTRFGAFPRTQKRIAMKDVTHAS